MTLYRPPDVLDASAWGANCGPAALAAAFEVSLADVFDAVSDQAGVLPGLGARSFRGYMGIAQMRDAVRAMGGRIVRSWGSVHTVEHVREANCRLPVLMCVQWGGPWRGTRGEAVYRHWVTLRLMDSGLWVYDINAGTEQHFGGCVPMLAWEADLSPRLMPKRGDGTWRMQWAGAVRR